MINGDFNGNVRKEINVYDRVYIGGILLDKEWGGGSYPRFCCALDLARANMYLDKKEETAVSYGRQFNGK